MQISWSLHQMRFLGESQLSQLYNYSVESRTDMGIIVNATQTCSGFILYDMDSDYHSLSSEQKLAASRCILKSQLYASNLQRVIDYFYQYQSHSEQS